MTPIEAMAKAQWEPAPFRSWGSLPKKLQEDQMQRMRAALLALADCEIPLSAMKAGIEAIASDDRYGGGRDSAKARNAFHAMLRSIATGG